MSTIATIAVTAAGLLLIAAALRDVFDTLFHRGSRGAISRTLMRSTWWVFHRVARLRRRLLSLAGPAMIALIVGTWAAMLALGWALVYLPHMPQGFYFSSVTGDAGAGDLVDAIYISLVTLATVGFGDITPVSPWLRLLSPLEALLGFGLLSGSISWLLSIYPALLRRHSLAYELSLLREAEHDRGFNLDELDPSSAEDMYADLTSRLIAVERDLETFPVTYYFSAAEERYALSGVITYLFELAERGDADGRALGVRLRATLLREAVDDFARTTASRFHGHTSDSTAEVLSAYTRDHMRAREAW